MQRNREKQSNYTKKNWLKKKPRMKILKISRLSYSIIVISQKVKWILHWDLFLEGWVELWCAMKLHQVEFENRQEKDKGFSQILFFGKEDQDRLGDEWPRDRARWSRRLLQPLLEMIETDKQASSVEGYRSCKKELWISNRGSLSDYSNIRKQQHYVT